MFLKNSIKMSQSEKVKAGIITAMDEEIILLRESISNERMIRRGVNEFYLGEIENVPVVILKCGIGKVNSAVGAALMINEFQPECIINSGSAGGMNTEMNVLDLVVSSKVYHHDVDVSCFGYNYGQVPGMPLAYEADKRLMDIATDAIHQLEGVNTRIGVICSGDSFVTGDDATDKIKKNFPDILAVEMEGAPIAQTCHLLDVPFVIIRAISDIPGKESNYKDFKDFVHDAGKVSAQMVVNMIKKL